MTASQVHCGGRFIPTIACAAAGSVPHYGQNGGCDVYVDVDDFL
jgi:hypothetical protein